MSDSAVYAAGAIVWRMVDDKLKVLLIHRTKYRDVTLPKGKVDPGEMLAETAVREVREESGIARGRISSLPVRLDRHDVPCGRDDDGRALASVHWDMQFVVLVPNAIPPVISDESDDLAWFPSLSLPDVDASVQALCEDAVRALSSPEDHPSQPLWVSFG